DRSYRDRDHQSRPRFPPGRDRGRPGWRTALHRRRRHQRRLCRQYRDQRSGNGHPRADGPTSLGHHHLQRRQPRLYCQWPFGQCLGHRHRLPVRHRQYRRGPWRPFGPDRSGAPMRTIMRKSVIGALAAVSTLALSAATAWAQYTDRPFFDATVIQSQARAFELAGLRLTLAELFPGENDDDFLEQIEGLEDDFARFGGTLASIDPELAEALDDALDAVV